MTELCTRYGPLAEVWFDGAGSAGRTYDWPGVAAVLERHQPQAMVFNLGRPTIRWVGNEDGLAADPCWYTAERTEVSLYDSGEAALPRPMYLPPECDVSIHGTGSGTRATRRRSRAGSICWPSGTARSASAPGCC